MYLVLLNTGSSLISALLVLTRLPCINKATFTFTFHFSGSVYNSRIVSVNSILPGWTIRRILVKQTTFSIMEIISFRFDNVSECCLHMQQVNDDYHDGHVIVF